MVQPLVSIIMSVYKANPFWFLTALRSAYAQTYPNIEVIIIYTEDYIEDSALLAMDDRFHYNNDEGRIRWVESPSPSSTIQKRTLGLKAARGKYTCYLDCDDYLLPNKVEVEVRAAQSSEALVVHSGFFYADLNLKIRGMFVPEEYVYEKLLLGRNFIPDYSLTNKRLYEEIGYPRWEEIGVMCYYDQWIRAGEALGPEAFNALKVPTWIYRFDDQKDRSKGPEYARGRKAHTERVLREAYFRTGGKLKK